MEITKEQAINLVFRNEDKEMAKSRDFRVLYANFIQSRKRKDVEYSELLRSVDKRVESCRFPDWIEDVVYATLLTPQEWAVMVGGNINLN